MKKLYTLSLLIISALWSANTASAQGLTLSIVPCGQEMDGNVWDLTKLPADLTHSGTTTINVAWERLSVDMPEEWATAVCDPNQCYAPMADQPLGPGSVLIPFSMDAGSTVTGAEFYVQFIPNGVSGSGSVSLRVYEVGNPNNSLTCNYTFNALATSIGDVQASSPLSIFPNPIHQTMRVNAATGMPISSVEIYSIVGRMIRKIELGAERQSFELDLGGLKEGMYFARFMNKDNELVESRRFSKVN